MNRHESSLDADYFESMFQGTDDPWDLETSIYEHDKLDHSIHVLGGRRYELGFEIGCAKGMLTQLLAPHCRALLAIDVSETALAAARDRCSELNHVTFGKIGFPAQAPLGGAFDLIILSEVAYYWDDRDLRRAADWISTHSSPGGDVLLVHWTGDTDYPQSGDEAVSKLRDALPLSIGTVLTERREHYRLDLWRNAP